MKCPTCHSDKTYLTWLREHAVTYWCSACHKGFDVERHRARSGTWRPAQAPADGTVHNGATQI